MAQFARRPGRPAQQAARVTVAGGVTGEAARAFVEHVIEAEPAGNVGRRRGQGRGAGRGGEGRDVPRRVISGHRIGIGGGGREARIGVARQRGGANLRPTSRDRVSRHAHIVGRSGPGEINLRGGHRAGAQAGRNAGRGGIRHSNKRRQSEISRCREIAGRIARLHAVVVESRGLQPGQCHSMSSKQA